MIFLPFLMVHERCSLLLCRHDFVPSRACSLSVRKVRITHLNESRQSRHLLGLRLLIILIIIVVASARTAVLDATLRRSSNQGSRASRQRRIYTQRAGQLRSRAALHMTFT